MTGSVAGGAFVPPAGRRLSAQVDRAAAGIDVLDARIPDWDDYRADFLAGVPLLSSADAAVDLEPGGRMAQRFSTTGLQSPGRLAEETARSPRNWARALRSRAASRTSCWATRRSHRRSPGCCVIWRGRRWRGSSVPWWRLRRWARRGAVASQVLPDVRICPRWPNWSAPTRAHAAALRGCCGTRWQFKRTGCSVKPTLNGSRV